MTSRLVRSRVCTPAVAVVVAIAGLGLAGCRETIEGAVARHRVAVEGMVKKVQALGPRLQAIGPITTARVAPLADAKVVRSGFGNTIVVHALDLAHPDSFAAAPERPRVAGELFSCTQALQTRSTDPFPPPVAPFAERLTTCAGIKYVVVLRTHRRQMAQMVTKEQFAGGRVDGDGLVFTLDGTYQGGFPWQAASAEVVPVKAGATQDQLNLALDLHLRDKVERAVLDELNRAWPGSAW